MTGSAWQDRAPSRRPAPARSDGSARRAVVLSVAVLVAAGCGGGNECPPNAACVAPTAIMYYKETPGSEPWGPDSEGTLPTDWKDRATAELSSRGLKFVVLDQVRISSGSDRPRFALK